MKRVATALLSVLFFASEANATHNNNSFIFLDDTLGSVKFDLDDEVQSKEIHTKNNIEDNDKTNPYYSPTSISFYTPSFSGLQFAVKYNQIGNYNDTDNKTLEGGIKLEKVLDQLSMNMSFSQKINVPNSLGNQYGIEINNNNNLHTWNVGLEFLYANQMKISASYSELKEALNDGYENHLLQNIVLWNATASYESGPASFMLKYLDQDNRTNSSKFMNLSLGAEFNLAADDIIKLTPFLEYNLFKTIEYRKTIIDNDKEINIIEKDDINSTINAGVKLDF